MRAIFRICRKNSQPGLQLVENLATSMMTVYLQKLKGMQRSKLVYVVPFVNKRYTKWGTFSFKNGL